MAGPHATNETTVSHAKPLLGQATLTTQCVGECHTAQPVCPLLQRLQPLLAGMQTAEDFIQSLLKQALDEFSMRISNNEKIPAERLEGHKAVVLASMRIKLDKAPHEKKPQCRAKTKAKKRCRHNAQWPTDFCHHHTAQREAHEKRLEVDRQVKEHDALVRARQAKGHNHKWTDDAGFQPDCAACAKLAPAHITASFSGRSISTQSDEEVDSRQAKRKITSAFCSA